MNTGNIQQTNNFIEEGIPTVLPVADEKYSNIQIIDQKINQYKDSPFGSRKQQRKNIVNEGGSSIKQSNQTNVNPQFSVNIPQNVNKNNKLNRMITYISEPYYQANKNYKKMKTQPNVKPKMHFQKNISQKPQIVNAPQTNQINNNQIIQENIQEQVIDNNSINANSNMIPQQDFPKTTNQSIEQNKSVRSSGNRVQHKIQNRQKYHEENIYQISNEDPNNPNEKKTRKIKVEITREQSINSNDTYDYDNGLKYINRKTVPKELNESNLSNVSFINRNFKNSIRYKYA